MTPGEPAFYYRAKDKTYHPVVLVSVQPRYYRFRYEGQATIYVCPKRRIFSQPDLLEDFR